MTSKVYESKIIKPKQPGDKPNVNPPPPPPGETPAVTIVQVELAIKSALVNRINKLEAEIERLQAERRWIPVSNHPAEGQRVIILLKDYDVSKTVFEGNRFMWDKGRPYKHGAVIGWMPLPKPPEATDD